MHNVDKFFMPVKTGSFFCLKCHHAVFHRKDGVIMASFGVSARQKLSAALAYDNIADFCDLAGKKLYAEAL